MQIDMYTHLIIQFTNLSKYICILHVEVYIYIYIRYIWLILESHWPLPMVATAVISRCMLLYAADADIGVGMDDLNFWAEQNIDLNPSIDCIF